LFRKLVNPSPVVNHCFEELDESHTLIERGSDWRTIVSIRRYFEPRAHGLSRRYRPITTLMFATQEDAEQARGEIARAVEKAIEVTSHG
jgi:hypothetical protein